MLMQLESVDVRYFRVMGVRLVFSMIRVSTSDLLYFTA